MAGLHSLDEANALLADMGYAAGVSDVIWRFMAHAIALKKVELRWRPDPPGAAAPTGEAAWHPNGIFRIESDGQEKARLLHVWPGWGRCHLATGKPQDLRAEALRIVRQGGPFGGPAIARKGEHIVQLREPQGGIRHPLSDGSEIRTSLLGDKMLGLRIWPDGRFVQQPITDSLDALAKSIEDDIERVTFDSKRVPWIFTSAHPILGVIDMAPFALLCCALRVDRVCLVLLRQPQEIRGGIYSWAELQSLDLRRETLSPWVELTPPSGVWSTPRTSAEEPKQPKQPPAAPSKRRRRVSTSPGAAPQRRGRRVRLKAPLAAAITRHLAEVASLLPARVLGVAFALELLRALEAAALSDHPTLSGEIAELFSRLHKKGLLADLPAAQAGRAALKMLAARTPLVRRIHYRRWCFAFGDLHDEKSALRARLGPLPPTG